jgi:ParB family transcriptional regulator, chromosome partitioning protein
MTRRTKPIERSNTEMAIDDIVIGERLRSDMGDIEGLAASIADIGLLNPISVDEHGQLLAGGRRLAACKLLRLETVEVRIIRENRT